MGRGGGGEGRGSADGTVKEGRERKNGGRMMGK